MITVSGKQILAKYLIEQAPSYASHIAVGCGLNPDANTDIEDFTNEKTLKFEMFREPITSRGYVTENGISKIVFSATLPSQEVYYISEAGIFSSKSNPIATVSDSRMVYTFSSAENWEYHSDTVSAITPYTVAYEGSAGVDTLADVNDGIIASAGSAPRLSIPFYIDTTDPLFLNGSRIQFKEQPRHLDSSIMISGGMSQITNTAGVWTATGGEHIHIKNQSLPFDVNSSSDEFVIAFSVIETDPEATNPTSTKIMIEFSTSETEEAGEYARLQAEVVSGDFDTNSGYFYFIKQIPFSELKTSANFTWNAVRIAKVYVDITGDRDNFVILDGLRFNNLSDMNANPLYGMTSYSPFYQGSGENIKPVLKEENTNNIIEVEFDIELGSVTS
jgi:hypothetical protein